MQGKSSWRLLLLMATMFSVCLTSIFIAKIYADRNSAENFKNTFGVPAPDKNDPETMTEAQGPVNEKTSALMQNFADALKERVSLEANYEFKISIRSEISSQRTSPQSKENLDEINLALANLSAKIKIAREKELRAKKEFKLAVALAKKYGLQIP